MAITLINVGTAPNDGTGDPIRTAYGICNTNFTELNARAQVTPPTTLIGKEGDQAGYYASDSNFFYYCFANYDGSSVIWAEVTQVGNVIVSTIASGNSNVTVALNSNVTVGIGGTSNVVVISNTGEFVTGVVSATGNVTGSYILGNGSLLTGLPATYANANVSAFLPTYSGNISAGNILVTTNVSVAGNITSDNTITNTIASGNILNTGSISAGGNVLAQGRVSATGNIETAGYFVGTFVGNVTGNFVIPGANTQVVFNSNGNADAVGGFTFDTNGPNLLTVLGTISSQGNVISGNITTAGLITATGNVIGGNVRAAGLVSAGGNILTAGSISATGAITSAANIIAGNITTAGLITATGNVIGGNVRTAGVITATGNVTGGNLRALNDIDIGGNITATNLTGTLVSVFGNVTGGNVRTAGLISATGNISGNYFLGNGSQLSGIDATSIQNGNSNIRITSAGSNVFVNVSGVSPVAVFANTGLYVTGLTQSTGNISGGNLLTGGSVSATGNVTGGNIIATGNLFYNGNILVTRSLLVGTRSTTVTIPLTASGSFSVGTRDSGNVIVTTST